MMRPEPIHTHTLIRKMMLTSYITQQHIHAHHSSMPGSVWRQPCAAAHHVVEVHELLQRQVLIAQLVCLLHSQMNHAKK
jgi:hypothetical protein